MQISECIAEYERKKLIDRVLAYENPELIERFKHKIEVTHEEAQQLFVDLKQFLCLCNEHPDKVLVPSKAIDAAWHQFILYTFEYGRFCIEFFGELIHHEPKSYLFPEPESGPGRSETFTLAEQSFGALSLNWGKDAKDAAKCEKNCSVKGGRRGRVTTTPH